MEKLTELVIMSFFNLTSSFYGVYQLEEKACVFNDASRNVFSIRLSFFLRRMRSGRKSQDTAKKAFILMFYKITFYRMKRD